MADRFRLLDLFSGIGGFSLGLERSGGFKTVAFCEIEPFPRRVLAKHWPEVPCYDDIRTLTAERLASDGIAVDAICGGFPCQDISNAGLRAGIGGERSGLWSEYARLIGEIRPRYVFVENVAALLVRGMGRVLGDLSAIGYDAEWRIISAADVGAPHRRDRVWVIAYPRYRGVSERPRETGWKTGERKTIGGEFGRDGTPQLLANPSRVQQGRQEQRAERERTRPGGEPEPSDGCHPNFPRLEVWEGITEDDGSQQPPIVRTDWWLVEPGMGGSPDGFPEWLDRCVEVGSSYAESSRAAKALRRLWNDHVSRSLQRSAGGLERLQQAQVLFAFLREYENETDEARLLVAGQEASEAFLRSLRERAVARRAPRRSGQDEQSTEQHPDAMQSMSRFLARYGETAWAACGWEDATPRVSAGIPSRVDRLKCLGNAVVPQIPEILGRAVMATRSTAAPTPNGE